jgi:hypothetical protein
MTLRGRFVIIGNYMAVSKKVSGNIEKVLKTLKMFWTLSKLYR